MNAPFDFDSVTDASNGPFDAPAPQTAGVLITGAANRIGRAIAQDLAAKGWPVVIHYNRSEQAAIAVRDEIRRNGGRADVLGCDLGSPGAAQDLVKQSMELVGQIGVLINNASVFDWDDLGSADEDSWAHHIDVNLRAPLFLCQSFVDRLAASQGGVIINMLDARVLNPTPRYLSYTVSKTGLSTLTKTLAQTLAPRVRVNGIGPGPTLPPAGQTVEQFKERCSRLPLKQPASLDDICEAVGFLISVRSITGQVIALDGGDHLAPQPLHKHPKSF